MRKPSKKAADTATRKAIVRCAVYTRKSSEEGLEQSFNSLDAQREACEAYVASQKSEGWIVLPQMYDDGGISGGTMERPALQRLLTDVGAGQIDTVVVYKVDRLTRSLGDFAKIVEVFDAAGVSFVSVTQSFNTTSSMGRLTLNMLLSFAQFEREVTGERIRDKIAASKARGMWMGGRVPLGYEVRERKLVVVDTEAENVRHIFHRYLELGSVTELRAELEASAIGGKRKVDGDGTETLGKPLDRGALYHLLQNRLYRGEISHKGAIHPGEHEAIVDEELWARVQTVLAANRVERKLRSNAASPALLAGLVRDEDGVPMTPTHANKKGRRYRYYVSNNLIIGRRPERGGEDRSDRSGARRIPAADLEAVVERSIRTFLADEAGLYPLIAATGADPVHIRSTIALLATTASRWSSLDRAKRISLYDRLVAGISVRSDEVDIAVRPAALLDLADPVSQTARSTTEDTLHHLTVPARLKRVGMEMRLLFEVPHRGPTPKPDRSLLRLLGQAHRFREMLLRGDGSTMAELAEEAGVTPSWFSRIVRLGFLSPRIITAIVDGTQPLELSADRLLKAGPVSSAWSEQLATYGFV